MKSQLKQHLVNVMVMDLENPIFILLILFLIVNQLEDQMDMANQITYPEVMVNQNMFQMDMENLLKHQAAIMIVQLEVENLMICQKEMANQKMYLKENP